MSVCFDKVAVVYGFLEKVLFGSNLQRMRLKYLDRMENSKQILLVGEGCGFFLEKLLKVNEKAVITIVEPSERMIHQAKARVPVKDRERVVFCNMTFERFVPSKTFDAAGTFFYWDCFRENQLKVFLPKLFDCLKAEGFLINVDFFELAHPDGTGLKLTHFILLRILFGFFGFATGIENTRVLDIEPIAVAYGFYATDTCFDEKLPVKGQVFQRRFVKSHP